LLAEARRWGNRIPSYDRDSSEQATKSAGSIAVDDDFAFSLVESFDCEWNLLIPVVLRPFASDHRCLDVESDGFFLAFELTADRLVYLFLIEIENVGENSNINNVGQ